MAEGGFREDAPMALWQELVREGESRAGLDLPEDVEAYLVFLLMRHLRDGALAGRTMALEWLQAMDLAGRARADALRDVGDRCLIIAGWYPALAERRRVSPDYFQDIGRNAYDGVAGSAGGGYGQLFARLAGAYRAMVRVLAATAAAAGGTMAPSHRPVPLPVAPTRRH
nr:hypothetical protein [Arenimonas fontis]